MQSIIVYRNPLEAMIWGQLMEGGMVWVAMTAAILSVLAAVVANAAITKFYPRARYANWSGVLIIVVAALVFAATIKVLIG